MFAGSNGTLNAIGTPIGSRLTSSPTDVSLARSSTTVAENAVALRLMSTPLIAPVTLPFARSAR